MGDLTIPNLSLAGGGSPVAISDVSATRATGKAAPGASVTIRVNGTVDGAAETADASGFWSHTFSATPAAGALVTAVSPVTSKAVPAPSAGITRLLLNSRLVGLGDSIAAGSSGASIFLAAIVGAGCRYYVPPSGNQGVGGSTTQNLLDRTATDNGSVAKTLTLNPAVVHLHIGTNDIGASGLGAAAIQTNLQAIFDRLLANGTTVKYIVVDTILPRADTGWVNTNNAAKEATRKAVNDWLIALTNPQILVVNLETAGLVTTTADYMSDLLHPGRRGTFKCASLIGAKLASVITTATLDTNTNTNLFTNLPFTGTGGTSSGVGTTPSSGVVYTGWSSGSQFTPSGANIVVSQGVDSRNKPCMIVDLGGTAPSAASILGLNKTWSAPGAVGEAFDLSVWMEWENLQGAVAPFLAAGTGVLQFDGLVSDTTVPQNFAGYVRCISNAVTATQTNVQMSAGLKPVSGAALGGRIKVGEPFYGKVS